MQHFSKTARILLLTISASLWLTACGAEKMSGSFVGEAKAELRIVSQNSGDYPEIFKDSSYNALAVITQDGDEVTLRFGNTPLLKNCELKAKNSRLSAAIKEGAICETDLAGVSRTVTIEHGEIYRYDDKDGVRASIKVYGFSGDSSGGPSAKDRFDLDFQGDSAK